MADHGMSKRRAGSVSGIARSTLRYRPVPRDDSGVITFILSHMALNTRHGFDLLYDSAPYQKQPWGKISAVARVLLTATEPASARQETAANTPQAAAAGSEPTQSKLELRLHVRRLVVRAALQNIQRHRRNNQEGLRIEIDTSLPAARVIRALKELVEVRGAPLSICLDNGPEFIAHALAEWAQSKDKGIAFNYI